VCSGRGICNFKTLIQEPALAIHNSEYFLCTMHYNYSLHTTDSREMYIILCVALKGDIAGNIILDRFQLEFN
jgi:hypothetical protein